MKNLRYIFIQVDEDRDEDGTSYQIGYFLYYGDEPAVLCAGESVRLGDWECPFRSNPVEAFQECYEHCQEIGAVLGVPVQYSTPFDSVL